MTVLIKDSVATFYLRFPVANFGSDGPGFAGCPGFLHVHSGGSSFGPGVLPSLLLLPRVRALPNYGYEATAGHSQAPCDPGAAADHAGSAET